MDKNLQNALNEAVSSQLTGKNLQNALNEAVSSQLTGKKWYESKAFWANLVMAGAVAIQSKYGFVVGPELQALFITGVNMLIRKFTKQPVVW